MEEGEDDDIDNKTTSKTAKIAGKSSTKPKKITDSNAASEEVEEKPLEKSRANIAGKDTKPPSKQENSPGKKKVVDEKKKTKQQEDDKSNKKQQTNSSNQSTKKPAKISSTPKSKKKAASQPDIPFPADMPLAALDEEASKLVHVGKSRARPQNRPPTRPKSLLITTYDAPTVEPSKVTLPTGAGAPMIMGYGASPVRMPGIMGGPPPGLRQSTHPASSISDSNLDFPMGGGSPYRAVSVPVGGFAAQAAAKAAARAASAGAKIDEKQGDVPTKKTFGQEIIQEAKRFKKSQLVSQLETYFNTLT